MWTLRDRCSLVETQNKYRLTKGVETMAPFTTEELRYYVKAARITARDLIFHLHDHSRNTLGMTAPVGNEVSRVLLMTLEDIDAEIHDGVKTGTLPAIAFLDVLRDNSKWIYPYSVLTSSIFYFFFLSFVN